MPTQPGNDSTPIAIPAFAAILPSRQTASPHPPRPEGAPKLEIVRTFIEVEESHPAPPGVLRPRSLTKAQEERMTKAFRIGLSAWEACHLAGVEPGNFYKWERKALMGKQPYLALFQRLRVEAVGVRMDALTILHAELRRNDSQGGSPQSRTKAGEILLKHARPFEKLSEAGVYARDLGDPQREMEKEAEDREPSTYLSKEQVEKLVAIEKELLEHEQETMPEIVDTGKVL
jgi:hypothetical protein